MLGTIAKALVCFQQQKSDRYRLPLRQSFFENLSNDVLGALSSEQFIQRLATELAEEMIISLLLLLIDPEV